MEESRQAASGNTWTFDPDKIWVEPKDRPVRMLHHPAYPFPAEWDGSERDLQRIACEYLGKVWQALELPKVWHDALCAGTDVPPLMWLFPLRDPNDPTSIRNSFAVERSIGNKREDRTIVLLACLVFNSGTPLFGGQGIRLVFHVGRKGNNGYPIRITSLTNSLPPLPAKGTGEIQALDITFEQQLKELASSLPAAAGIPDATNADIGLRVTPPSQNQSPFEVLTTTTPAGKDKIAYVLRTPLTISMKLPKIASAPLIANAAVNADVFVQDPMSKLGAKKFYDVRPNRPNVDLDPARVPVAVDVTPNGAKYKLLNNWVNVIDSKWLDLGPDNNANAGDGDTTEIASPLTGKASRTNEFAALNAHYHASTLFDRMVAFGFDPTQYFKFAALPLLVRYRSRIVPGSGANGKTVNAQVAPIPTASNGFQITPWDLEVRFALGDLRFSYLRSPLGVACDPRWCWHEFSHVLLFAATGALEFCFAHSAGDAMGAIICDPDSKLAEKNGLAVNDPAGNPWRYVTFPWIASPRRRHDRSVAEGWGWNGALYQPERFYADEGGCNHVGYHAEQILSTTLFRLYRAIGGDAQDGSGHVAPQVRRAAADYALYLIMRAIALVGPVAVNPASTVGQFVAALIDADIGTGVFNVGTNNPADRRIGGITHKVIRWAFERQGLPAVGAAPDVYIADQRKQPYDPSDPYAPVTFDSDAWHATPGALWVRQSQWWWWPPTWPPGGNADQPPRPGHNNYVFVNAGNSGTIGALGVRVRVWFAEMPLAGAAVPPDWLGRDAQGHLLWTEMQPVSGDVHDVARGSTVKFGPFEWPNPATSKRYALFAEASCTTDRANTDATTGLPCTSLPNPTQYLVAGDNNLGLRVITVPP